MQLENVVFDAVEPDVLGRHWEDLTGAQRLTDDVGGVESRLPLPDGQVLDLCFPRVEATSGAATRLHLDVAGGVLSSLRLESADPDRDAAFWSWLTGWPTVAACSLRHPSGHGPVLELVAERSPKPAGKNPVHLDVRLEAGEEPDAVAAGIAERGGRELDPGWGDLPWRVFADPSGNELCVLPQSTSHDGAG